MGQMGLLDGGMWFGPGTMGASVEDVLLQDMDFDFGDLGDFMGVATGGMPMDHF
jgi:hypothetical protein